MLNAAIDLGTVTSRLMVGASRRGKVEVLERCIIITDMGEGLAEKGYISDAAYARVLAALLEFREVITDVRTRMLCEGRDAGEIAVKIIATSALRDASNSEELLESLRDMGFTVEVISGHREAELSFKGTLSGFSGMDHENPVMTIDVGGGSTEVILGSRSGITASRSFDIGSRRVTELFLRSDPPGRDEMEQERAWVTEQCSEFFKALQTEPSEVIAVAGTATSAVTIRDGIDEYDSKLVHGKRVSIEELESLIDTLALLCLDERREVRGLHPGRAAVIVGGLIILACLLKMSGKNSLLVSDTDILEGIILDESAIC